MTLTTHHLGSGLVASRARVAVDRVSGHRTGMPRLGANWHDVAGEVCPGTGRTDAATAFAVLAGIPTVDGTIGVMDRKPTTTRLLGRMST